MNKQNGRSYLIPVLSKALDILELLQADNQPLSLEEIHERTKISKTTAYRILKTFVHRGYLSPGPNNTYRHAMRPKKLRFGFGSQSSEMSFSREVSQSLRSAARAHGVELLEMDNRYESATAVKNAEELIAARVDLIIEFNVRQDVAPVIGEKITAAKIPLIAIDIPHPNATYFGVDNYRVGVLAGEILAEHARHEWEAKVDWVIGLDITDAGPLLQARVSGAFDTIRSALPNLPEEAFVRLDGHGIREHSKQVIGAFLRRHPKDRQILMAAATDTSALGALEAVREQKRERDIAIASQDCISEALEEMRKPASPLIASVSHEAHTYGPSLMQLGLALLQGQTVPPYNYVKHRVVTRESLAERQPNDPHRPASGLRPDRR